MYITDFEYANRMLSDFNCITCHINTSSGLEEIDIGCDINFNTVKNGHSSIHSVTSSTYENVYSTTFEIVKDVCNRNSNDIYMTTQEARAITKWLNRRDYHKLKLFNSDYEVSDICYYGSFNVRQIMIDGKIIGLSLTFTSNAPYGFGDKLESVYYMLDTESNFSICGDSDEINTIYPNVMVTCYCQEPSELIITNSNTGAYVSVKNCTNGETICMDGEHKIITTDNDAHKKTLYKDFNYEFLEIEPEMETEDGTEYENVFTVSMPCKVTISYSPIRKVGV